MPVFIDEFKDLGKPSLGENFHPDLTQFPVDLRGLTLPEGWEETKWQHRIGIRGQDDIVVISLNTLIDRWLDVFGVKAELAFIESVNETNGRQVFFGLNPESKPDHEFSGPTYVERGLGGATNVPYVLLPDGGYAVGLLRQYRPLLFQGGEILQVMGGYPINVDGNIDVIHAATLASEMDEMGEFRGKFRIKREDVMTFGRRYNPNKAMCLTGTTVDDIAGGISVQGTRLPYELLIPNGDGTWRIDRDLVALDGHDRTLERITSETFFRLDRDLIREVRNPSNGAPSCIHTETAIVRAFDCLVLEECN